MNGHVAWVGCWCLPRWERTGPFTARMYHSNTFLMRSQWWP